MNGGMRLIFCFLFEISKWEWGGRDEVKGGYYFNLDLRGLRKELGTYKGTNSLVKGYYF